MVTGLVAVYLLVPTLIVIPASFSSSPFLDFPPPGWSLRWYDNFFGDPNWTNAAIHSIEVAIAVTVLAVVMGTAAAFALVRWRGKGSAIAKGIISLPLIVPVIIYAVGFFGLLSQTPLMGTLTGLALAQTALALPFVVVNVSAPLARLDRNQEKAARSLGASATRSFRDIVLPQIRPGVFAGALFAFLTSFIEVVMAMFLTTPATQTLPVQMWSGIRLDIDPTIAAAASLLLAASTVVMLISAFLSKEGES